MIAADLLERFEGVRQMGPDRWLAKCPAHDDRSPSLSIRDVGDKLLLHDFGGCDALDVVHAIGLELTDLFPDRPERHSNSPGRSRIPASDALAAIDHESLTVSIIGADIMERRDVDEATWERLALAVSRIGAARDMTARLRK